MPDIFLVLLVVVRRPTDVVDRLLLLTLILSIPSILIWKVGFGQDSPSVAGTTHAPAFLITLTPNSPETYGPVMVGLASPKFLSHLKSLYPAHNASCRYNPWDIIAAVGFASSNRPEGVPLVYQHAMAAIEGRSRDEKLFLVRRFRDAIFKSGLTSGYPKAINGLKALFDVTPEDLRDSTPLRDVTLSTSDFDELGRAFFEQTYGPTAGPVQSLLDTIYPDLGWFSNHVGYGITYSFNGSLTAIETSYTLCTALIAADTPLQIGWHLSGALRNGATLEEVRAVRRIAIEVTRRSGVVRRNDVPEIDLEDTNMFIGNALRD